MAVKYFGVTPNQSLNNPSDSPSSFLWYEGYINEAGNIRVSGGANAQPVLVGEDPNISINPEDEIHVFDYRSVASFSEDFLSALPDSNSIDRIYNTILNRDADPAGKQFFLDPVAYSFNQHVIESICETIPGEYISNKSSLYEYPVYLSDEDDALYLRGDDYAEYVNINQASHGILDFYNNGQLWDYQDGNGYVAANSKSQQEFGESHYKLIGRGQGWVTPVISFGPGNYKLTYTDSSKNLGIFGYILRNLNTAQTNEYSYTVTANSDNTAYLWNGHGLIDAINPDLYFRHGDSITITNDSGAHIMEIIPDIGGANITESSGLIYINAALEGNYTYRCTTPHASMTGRIYIGRPYVNQGPEDGYGIGPLPLRKTAVSFDEMRIKVNEILARGLPDSGGAKVSASPPEFPEEGDLWFNDNTSVSLGGGLLFIYSSLVGGWVQLTT